MRTDAVDWALSRNLHDPAAKLTLLFLALRLNDRFTASLPDMREIADFIGASVPTTRNKVRWLDYQGLIERGAMFYRLNPEK